MSDTEINVMITMWTQYIHTLQQIKYIYNINKNMDTLVAISEARTKIGKIYISMFNIVMFIKV